MKSRVSQYVVEAIRSPRDSLTRGQHFVRHSIELTGYCWRQLRRHRAEGMAAELTYRTIFSLIPVVVLGLVMFRIFGGLDDMQSQVENQLYSFFGVPEIAEGYESPTFDTPVDSGSSDEPESADALRSDDDLAPSGTPGDDAAAVSAASVVDMQEAIAAANDATQATIEAAAAEAQAESEQQARASIRRTLHDVTAQVSQIDFKSVGVFGLLLFIYAAVALANSAEGIFNRIYDAPAHRPIHLRFAIHWSIITLGSGLLAMSLYLSGQVVDWVAEISEVSNFRYVLNHLLSITASWILLFLLYALMPNTIVSVRAAAVGSLVGALLWEAAKFGFQIYVVKAVPYSAIYGSLGLIPLFLFWIYVTWLIILFGLILTYTLQVWRGRPVGDVEAEQNRILAGDPEWMLPIVWEVSLEFESGRTISDQSLADRLGLPAHAIRQMTSKLGEANVLRRVQVDGGEQTALALARPAEQIRVREILSVAHQVGTTSQHPAWKKLAFLKQAEREAAAEQTIKDLLPASNDGE